MSLSSVQLSSLTARPSCTPTTIFALSVTICPVVLQVRREMLAQARNGIIIPPLTSFDGNVITPGTPFMARLAAHLRRFLAYKVGNDSDWRHIQVIPALVHQVVCKVCACTVHRVQWVLQTTNPLADECCLQPCTRKALVTWSCNKCTHTHTWERKLLGYHA